MVRVYASCQGGCYEFRSFLVGRCGGCRECDVVDVWDVEGWMRQETGDVR
jgi:hypothetical protein